MDLEINPQINLWPLRRGRVEAHAAEVSGFAQRSTYRIELLGTLDENWSEWLSDVTISFEQQRGLATTVMTASLDQAGLRGVLNRMWEMNLTVLSVCRPSPTKSRL